MRHLTGIKDQNVQAVLLSFKQALLDGAVKKAIAIEEANPDLKEQFDKIDMETWRGNHG